MEQGPSEERLLQQVRQNPGMAIPDKIANAPDLLPGLEMYWIAFSDLTTCRSEGMDEGRIPWTAVIRYAEWLKLNDEETDDFVTLIKAMDETYINHRRGEAKRKSKTTLAPKTRPPLGKR